MSPLLAGSLVFFTSAAVLVLEILAGRLLAPYVGVTLETFTGIIGVVLAGIAGGTWYGGRLADRHDPHRLLGPMLVLGGALGAASVLLVRVVGGVGIGRGPAAIVILTTVAFFLPSAVLSAVTPTVVKIQLSDLDETGAIVGQLSALGTIGALFGTFITGFFLVAALPTPPIIYGVSGVLVLSGVWLFFRLRTPETPAGDAKNLAVIALLGLAGASLGAVTPSPCQQETAYFCASVLLDEDRPGGRLLFLDTLRHSYVDLDDLTHLELSYAQTMSDVLETIAPEGEPMDVLHIGGGGFSLPRYLAETRPGTFSRVLELDADLVRIGVEELGLEITDDLQVETGDARINLQDEPDDRYDLVIGDAFGGQAVPWHLTTEEFTRDIERTLTPGGVYAINLIDYESLSFARAEAATIRAVFDHVAVLANPNRIARREGGNFIMVGSNEPLPLEAMQERNAARGDDEIVVGDEAGLDAFIDGAIVLTDDYAPVDQLLTPLD